MMNKENKKAIDHLVDSMKDNYDIWSTEKLNKLYDSWDDDISVRIKNYLKVKKVYSPILHCCNRFYTSSSIGFENTFERNEVNSKELKPQLLADSLLPFTNFKNGQINDTLKKIILYSNFSIITLPIELYTRSISYDNEGIPYDLDIDLLRKCLNVNYEYMPLVKNHQVLFLPERIHEYFESTWAGKDDYYIAPFEQEISSFDYLPYNISHPEIFDTLIKIELPYFPEVGLEDLVKIKMNETDSFLRFQYFLKKKINELCSDKNQSIKEFTEEINYEILRLNIEAKKLSNLKIMKGVSFGVFTISLGTLLLTGHPELQKIAGLLGSTSLYNIFKEYMDKKSKVIDLKKDTFYIPFVFKEIASKK